MDKFKVYFSIFLFFLLLTSCKEESTSPKKAHLFYDNNVSQIYQYNLSQMIYKKVYEGSYCLVSNNISSINNAEILITDGCSSKEKSGYPAIVKINLQQHTKKYITDGKLLQYFTDAHKIFYYKNGYIWIADFLEDVILHAKLLCKSTNISIVEINPTFFVYADPSNGNKVFLYDTSVEKSFSLPLKDCRPLFYRSANKELICQNQAVFFSTMLDGHNTKEITPIKQYVSPYFMAYFSNSDEMIFSVLTATLLSGETIRYYSYNFKKNQVRQLNFIMENSN